MVPSMKDIGPERTPLNKVSGTITVPASLWNIFRKDIMSENFNQLGMSVEQLMDMVRDNIVPNDNSSYQVTYTNKPKDHFIEVSIERVATVEGVENQVVANLNFGHSVMSTAHGAFDLETSWINQTLYPPGEVDA
jgi:hypothetical protein